MTERVVLHALVLRSRFRRTEMVPCGLRNHPATLPPEIDFTNASGVLELITAACAPGVAVVIADLTGTSFCDSAGLRHLIQAGHEAAGAGAELRLAIAPDGAVSRVVELTGINRHLAVYPTLQMSIGGIQQSG